MVDRFLSQPPLVLAAAACILLLVGGWRYVEWRREAGYRANGRHHHDG